MFEKKNFLLNCDVCDTRKMKEEDYSGYEKMTINADIVIVNETSKSILNRLPLTMNHGKMLEVSDDIEFSLKLINGPCEIDENSAVENHTILTVNGPLLIHPCTEEIMKKYEFILVNGPVKYPKSMKGYLNNISVNGPISAYPDDCIILDKNFTIDKYFPLRAKEGSKYYAEKLVAISDTDVDILKLVQKNVQFITKRLIVPECKIEDCVPLFDEQTEFVVVPDGMKLIMGDVTLNEDLIQKNGGLLFVYGNLKLDENADTVTLCQMMKKLIVKGTVKVLKNQKDDFLKLDAEYDKLKVYKNTRNLSNVPQVKLDNHLFDNSPEGIHITNVATIIIDKDVLPATILDKLTIENCAAIICDDSQESAVIAIAKNVAKIGHSKGDILADVNPLNALKDFANTKAVNADSYIM